MIRAPLVSMNKDVEISECARRFGTTLVYQDLMNQSEYVNLKICLDKSDIDILLSSVRLRPAFS